MTRCMPYPGSYYLTIMQQILTLMENIWMKAIVSKSWTVTRRHKYTEWFINKNGNTIKLVAN